MVSEPRIWDIPAILGSFVISNAGIAPVVPYTGRVSPGFSGAAVGVLADDAGEPVLLEDLLVGAFVGNAGEEADHASFGGVAADGF
ncbi:MAG TPA: hypothetical protein QGH28_03925, partial [Chloroflexota bacterium]|nr:hypothetical protein [Chloroflexota bacterium]